MTSLLGSLGAKLSALLLGPYPYDEARTKALQVIAIAREAGAPLLASLAKTRTT